MLSSVFPSMASLGFGSRLSCSENIDDHPIVSLQRNVCSAAAEEKLVSWRKAKIVSVLCLFLGLVQAIDGMLDMMMDGHQFEIDTQMMSQIQIFDLDSVLASS